MVIWSGWGILVVLCAFIGIVAGGFIGTAIAPLIGGIVGGGVAAFLNHTISKAVDKPALKLDPNTGEQYLQKKSNSLFFIPMRFFTPVLALVGIVIGIGGMSLARHEKEMDAKYPGKRLFDQASEMIDRGDGEIYHGNSPTAKAAAQVYGTTLKELEALSFSDDGGVSTSDGKFRTYCHQGDEVLIFLCHVPDLKSYQDDSAKRGLMELAWGCGQAAAETLEGVTEETLMVVGLRGTTSYDYVLKGAVAESPQMADDKKVSIYLAFDPTVNELK